MKKILLDSKEVEVLVPESLPMLIHGEEGSGASLYTICLAAKWFSQGYKVLFLCGYPMAEVEFAQQVNTAYPNVTFYTKEKVANFITSLNSTEKNTIVFVKNIELFDKNVFEAVEETNNLIISGCVSKVSFKDNLLEKKFTTEVYFSSLDGKDVPYLEKFHGFVMSDGYKGVTSLS